MYRLCRRYFSGNFLCFTLYYEYGIAVRVDTAVKSHRINLGKLGDEIQYNRGIIHPCKNDDDRGRRAIGKTYLGFAKVYTYERFPQQEKHGSESCTYKSILPPDARIRQHFEDDSKETGN